MSIISVFFGKSRKKKIEFFVPYVRNRDVIDIGCAGEGPYDKKNWIHEHIEAASKYCIGIDHNEGRVSELRLLGYNVVFGDATNIKIDRQFDVVCALDVIEHIEDLKSFFENVDKILKNEGSLLISIPNPWFFLRFVRCIIKGDGGVHPDHVYWFCSGTITELLRRFGFKVQRLEFGSGEPRLYYLYFLPKVLRHASIYVVAAKARD